MKKKIILFVLCTIILLSACGCVSKKSKESSNNEKNLSDVTSRLGLRSYELKCDELKDIVDINFNASKFITKNGDIYDLDAYKLFSANDKNCKKVETDIKAKKFIGSRYIVDENNNLYGYYNLNKLKKIDKNIELFAISYGIEIKNYYYYKDKNIYEMNNDLTLTDNIFFTLKDDEDLEYIVDDTIKTTKRLYIAKQYITNEEQCKKYADIECNYEYGIFEIDDDIKEHLDEIIFYKDERIVTKNGILYANCPGCGG